MSTLVMWSGGIDSTYVLAELLCETDVPVHAHHINLINHECRHVAEKKAVDDLLPKLQAIRPFVYTESTIDHSQYRGIPYDMAVVCFEAGCVARDTMMRKNPAMPAITQWTVGTHKAEGHWNERWDVIKQITRGVCWHENTPEFYVGLETTKREEIQYLGKLQLFDDTWYCRTPVDGQRCVQCKTCQEVLEATK